MIFDIDLVFTPHSGSSGNGLMGSGAALSRALSKSDALSSETVALFFLLKDSMTFSLEQQILVDLNVKNKTKMQIRK